MDGMYEGDGGGVNNEAFAPMQNDDCRLQNRKRMPPYLFCNLQSSFCISFSLRYTPANVQNLASKFIVFDGPEGCGKTTQTHLLKNRLEQQGAKVELFRDPGSTRIGERIRQILLNPDHQEMAMRCEMLLYMAARAQMMRELIIPALKDGAVVICDRFVSSTLAYQLGGDGPDQRRNKVRRQHRHLVPLARPHPDPRHPVGAFQQTRPTQIHAPLPRRHQKRIG